MTLIYTCNVVTPLWPRRDTHFFPKSHALTPRCPKPICSGNWVLQGLKFMSPKEEAIAQALLYKANNHALNDKFSNANTLTQSLSKYTNLTVRVSSRNTTDKLLVCVPRLNCKSLFHRSYPRRPLHIK